MAAPTNAASEDSPCQPGAVHTWPLADMPNAPTEVCSWQEREIAALSYRDVSRAEAGTLYARAKLRLIRERQADHYPEHGM